MSNLPRSPTTVSGDGWRRGLYSSRYPHTCRPRFCARLPSRTGEPGVIGIDHSSQPNVSPNVVRICAIKPDSPPRDSSCVGACGCGDACGGAAVGACVGAACGVTTAGPATSDLAPRSGVKSCGEALLRYSAQPIPTPSNTSTTSTAIRIPQLPANDFSFGSGTRGAADLQVRHQRLQLAEGGRVDRGLHPLAVLLRRQLALAQR